ncbi:MAG: sporulation protein YqfD, partial [Clostridia bacterium]|nr:sporulation protein YqfD [Clostridia bacterium]
MLIRFFGGGLRLRISGSDKSRAFSVFARDDVPFWGVETEGDSFTITVPYYRKKKILSALRSLGIEWEATGVTGIAAVFRRFDKRFGLIIGAVICALMIWLSEQVIWSVEVKGNSTVSDKEIISLLDSLGCGVGDRFKEIDFDVLHNRFLMECRDISWIAVNMNGTHANVEVMETAHGGDKAEESGYYNVVATETGHIELISCKSGDPVVKIYDTVLEGELLISAVVSYRQDTMTRLESADGNVYARVFRDFEVFVPFETEKKVYTGEKTEKKTVSFFNFDINLFLNSRIPYKVCDKITVYNQIYLFDAVPLPLFVEKDIYTPYEVQRVTLTEEEAFEQAAALYKDELEKTLNGAQLLSKNVTETVEEDGVTVRCELYCLAD